MTGKLIPACLLQFIVKAKKRLLGVLPFRDGKSFQEASLKYACDVRLETAAVPFPLYF